MDFIEQVNAAIGQALDNRITQEKDCIDRLRIEQKQLVAEAATCKLATHLRDRTAFRISEHATMPTRETLRATIMEASSKHSDYQRQIIDAENAIGVLNQAAEHFAKEGKLPPGFDEA